MPPLAVPVTESPPEPTISMAPAVGAANPTESASAELRRRKIDRRHRLWRNSYQMILLAISMGFSWFLFAKYIAPAIQARNQQAQAPPQIRHEPAPFIGPELARTNNRPIESSVTSAADDRRRVVPRDLPPTRPEPEPEYVVQPREVPSTSERSDVTTEPRHAGPTESFVVDLSRRTMTIPLELDEAQGPARVKLLDFEKCDAVFRFVPDDALVLAGRPVDLLFEEFPTVRLRFTIANRNSLRFTPQIDVGLTEPVDFTERRVKTAMHALVRQANRLMKARAVVAEQRNTTAAWLASRGEKALHVVKEAKNQVMALDAELATADAQIQALQMKAESLERIRQLGTQLHQSAYVVYVLDREG